MATHLDFDHAGGLEDFPSAEIHVLRAEYDAAREPRGFIGRRRYEPSQWGRDVHWRLYDARRGEPWFGFAAVRQLAGLPPEILMIPLRGHTLGHAGVAVRRGDGWLLHAGDAYFDRLEMDPTRPRCAIGRRAYEWMMDSDRSARLHNQQRLRKLVARPASDVEVFCSHDPLEFLASAAPPAVRGARTGRTPITIPVQ